MTQTFAELLSFGKKNILSAPKEAEQALLEALKLDASVPEVYFLLTNIYDHTGQRQPAVEQSNKLIELLDAMDEATAKSRQRDNWYVAAANNLCRFGKERQAFEIASKAFDRLGRPLRLAPAYLFICQAAGEFAETSRVSSMLLEAYKTNQDGEIVETPRSSTVWCEDPEINVRVAKKWRRAAIAPQSKDVVFTPRPAGRIRVGYLSGDFRNHPTARLVKGLLKNHDKTQFEVFLFCSGWDDGSDLRKETLSYADAVHSVTDLSDAQAAELIRSLNIDILVELNGPTRAHRLGILAHRCAPVQVGYLGFPGSYGGDLVDYIIADKNTIPEHTRKFYPEKIIYVSGTYQVNDYAPLEPSEATNASLMLPPAEKGPLLGVFNKANKINLEVWSTWCRILRTVPTATLCILDPGQAITPALKEHVKGQGLGAGRIVVVPALVNHKHMERLSRFDLMLDTWPYGGHTTTADALWAGVPVVAMERDSFASRVSSGLLKAGGLKQLVATTPEEYERIAIGLLKNPELIKNCKDWISKRTRPSVVFNNMLRSAEIEKAFHMIISKNLQRSTQNL